MPKKFDEKRQRIDWGEIDPLLGKSADLEIATQLGVASSTVTRRRNALGIPPVSPPGQPRHQKTKKRNAGIALSEELIEILDALPQIQATEKKDGWSRSYLVEQVLRNYLSLPADYDWDDLQRIVKGAVIV